ncbi:MAG: DUF421 domain-containing protein [Chromatocurvus sp.]
MAVFAYASLIVILRLSGKRTLSKMNAFDLVVTVALGSTLATVILSKNVALAEGVAAMSMLVLLQFVVTWCSVRSVNVRRMVRSEPTLLMYRGTFLREAMKAQRVTETEVRQAARSQGNAELAENAVVLETDGRFSVLPAQLDAIVPAMHDVETPHND